MESVQAVTPAKAGRARLGRKAGLGGEGLRGEHDWGEGRVAGRAWLEKEAELWGEHGWGRE